MGSKHADNENFVRIIQSSLGLKVDGWAGEKTLEATMKALSDASVPAPPVNEKSPLSVWEFAFKKVIGEEGGFQNDSRDKGNWTGGQIGVGQNKGTKFGVAAASYPDLDIRNLTLEDAKDIYYRDFWQKISADKMPAPIAYMLFDMSINHGRSLAAQLLQRALGVAEDGKIGPTTLGAIPFGMTGIDELIEDLTKLRQAKYRSLAAASSNYAAFLGSENPRRGWLGRSLNVRDEARSLL